jgi:hypothetical protein
VLSRHAGRFAEEGTQKKLTYRRECPRSHSLCLCLPSNRHVGNPLARCLDHVALQRPRGAGTQLSALDGDKEIRMI